MVSGDFTFGGNRLSQPAFGGMDALRISANVAPAISETPPVDATRRAMALGAPAAPRAVGRPSEVANLGPRISAWLAADRTLTGVEVFRRARSLGYRGGKTALYDFVRRLRSATAFTQRGPAAAHGVYAAFEFIVADVRFATEGRCRVVVLVGELVWSGFVHAVAGVSADPTTTVRCLGSAFSAFGGVPLAMQWLSPRLVRRPAATGTTVWEASLARFALDAGCALHLSADERRGGSRRAARAVRADVLAAREFENRADLDVRLRTWATEVNHRRDPRRGSPPAARLREEQSRLLPCPEVGDVCSGNPAP